MFESAFVEGSHQSDEQTVESGCTDTHRTMVNVDDDFDVLHNILYYLYTDQISFSTDLDASPFSKELPRFCSAEAIYAIADKMMLEDLKRKVLGFLESTCTVENITGRTMSEFASVYKPVGDLYAKFYRANWGKVRSSAAHSQFFSSKFEEEDMDGPEWRELFKRYRAVMEDSEW